MDDEPRTALEATLSVSAERWRRADEVELKRLALMEQEIADAPARHAAADRQTASTTRWNEEHLVLTAESIASHKAWIEIVQHLMTEQNALLARIVVVLEAK